MTSSFVRAKVDRKIDPLCECTEDDETSYHVLAYCPIYGGSRFAIFGAPELGSDDIILSSGNLRVLEFIKFLSIVYRIKENIKQ